ncbi:MAG: AraC family transcriptional regulator ligand-binding domain-containing protein [Pseudomonadales bacterium]|nr:AraC family transcriptional regulator ligand-binding domain-containing protein [Pseudomonadales bacterium]
MNKSLTVFSGTLNAVFQAAEQFGVVQRDLLLAADLDEAMLRQADQRFPVNVLYDVYASAEKASNNPDLGLTVGRISFLTGLNLQLYMGNICHDVRDYLNLMPSLLKLKGDIGELQTRKQDQSIIVEWKPLSAGSNNRRHLSDEVLAATALVFDSLCILPIPIQEAHFSYSRPADTRRLQAAFGSHLRFDQPVSALYFDRKILNYPLVEQDYGASSSDSRRFQNLFDAEDSTDNFLSKLRRSITQYLPEGEIGLDTVAADLNVSRRTLQRRLRDKGTQFSQVLQDVRLHLAVRYLSDKRLAMAEIAFLLGYSDQATFSNAFKSWYGMSPSEYRLKPNL